MTSYFAQIQGYHFTNLGYAFDFTETGQLPIRTEWCVRLYNMINGKPVTQRQCSLNSFMAFSAIPGTYSYYVEKKTCGSGCQFLGSGTWGTVTIPDNPHTPTVNVLTKQYKLTITVSPSACGTTTPLTDWENATSNVSISESPYSNLCTSTGWWGSGSGSYTGSNPLASVIMNAPITETASFTFQMQFNEYYLPSGTTWKVTFAGVNHSSSSATITIGNLAKGNYPWSVPPVSCGSGCQLKPSQSSGTANVGTTLPAPVNVAFPRQYYLSMGVSGGGGGSISPLSGWYNASSLVTISATPSQGSTFSSWAGSGSGSYIGSSPSAMITINSSISEGASFATSVTFTESGLPTGTSWGAILDGSTYSSTAAQMVITGVLAGSHPYSLPAVSCGSGCQYSPTPSSGSVSVGNSPVTLSVAFTEQYYLTMNLVYQGLGACGGATPSSAWYQAGATVTIKASWATGCIFYGWTGSGSGSYTGKGTLTGSNPYYSTTTITMNGPVSETATFYCRSMCADVVGAPGNLLLVKEE